MLIMKELPSWEQEMRSWTPQAPSARLGRRLFGQGEPAPLVTLRRAAFWMTPMAACALTMLLAVSGLNHRSLSESLPDDSLLYAALDSAPSNSQRMVRMSQMDENVQWNVCPRLAPLSSPAKSADVEPEPAVLAPRNPVITNLNR